MTSDAPVWEDGETPAAVRRAGSLRIGASAEEEQDCAAQLAAMRADALPVETYDGPEGRGLLFPPDASFNPLRRCRTLAERALGRGAALFEGTRAVRVEPGVVATPDATIRCDVVIVTIDGRLTRLLPELSSRVRTARIPRPVYSRYGYEYWQRAPVERRWAASVGYTADGMPVLEEVRPRVWVAGAYSGTGNLVGALCGRAAARLAMRGDASLAARFMTAPPSTARPA